MTADFSWHRPYRAISQVAFSHFNWKKFSSFTFIEENPGRRRSTTTNIDATTVTFSPFYKLLARPEQLALFTPGIGDQGGVGAGKEGGVDHARKNTPKIWNSSLRRAMKKKSILNSVWNFFFRSRRILGPHLHLLASPGNGQYRRTFVTTSSPECRKMRDPENNGRFRVTHFKFVCFLLLASFFFFRWNARLRVLIIFAIQGFFSKSDRT